MNPRRITDTTTVPRIVRQYERDPETAHIEEDKLLIAFVVKSLGSADAATRADARQIALLIDTPRRRWYA